ncbi:MAG: hypothetical protein E6Q97_03245 [Desulfurellales bacterium]|nr:MAG: hypothetical protein E6Q97_03245 [Desulfurellales bacterium]
MATDDVDIPDVFDKYRMDLHVSVGENAIQWFYMVGISRIYVAGAVDEAEAVELLRVEADIPCARLIGPFEDEFIATVEAEMSVAQIHKDDALIKELRRIHKTWTNLGK